MAPAAAAWGGGAKRRARAWAPGVGCAGARAPPRERPRPARHPAGQQSSLRKGRRTAHARAPGRAAGRARRAQRGRRAASCRGAGRRRGAGAPSQHDGGLARGCARHQAWRQRAGRSGWVAGLHTATDLRPPGGWIECGGRGWRMGAVTRAHRRSGAEKGRVPAKGAGASRDPTGLGRGVTQGGPRQNPVAAGGF